MFISPALSGYNMEGLKADQGIYFVKISNMNLVCDEWKLIVYYDMNPYSQGVFVQVI